MFAYCGNSPVNRSDATGHLWGTLATIGIGSLASVATSALTSWLAGEEFTIGDAVGAAIEGAAATAMMIVGVPLIIANPAATFCGGVIGKFIDGDFSENATYEILEDTGKTALTTVAFAGAGKIGAKYADVYLDGKYVNLNAAEEFIKDTVYQPKYLNKSSVRTVVSDSFWDSVRTLAVDMVW